jgi:hypothetical protein
MSPGITYWGITNASFNEILFFFLQVSNCCFVNSKLFAEIFGFHGINPPFLLKFGLYWL